VFTKAEAEQILEPYLQLFRECVTKAWQEYLTKYAHVRQDHSARSRASVIHDHMVGFAMRFFDGMDGVRISRKRGLVTVNIQDQFRARFKKLDKQLHSRNIPTQQSLLFKAQLDLPGIKSTLTHIDVGYVLNDLQTALAGVYITCPYGTGIEWWLDLNDYAKSGVVAPIVAPPAPTPQPSRATGRKRRIKPKVNSDGRKENEDKP
jgi:hypothetical protein